MIWTGHTQIWQELASILQQPVDDGTAVARVLDGLLHSCWPLGRSPGLDGTAWTAADHRRRDSLLPHNHRRGLRLGVGVVAATGSHDEGAWAGSVGSG